MNTNFEVEYFLSEKFNEALTYAAKIHHGQLRNRTQIPYLSHLLSVCAIVLEEGGDEVQAIAALLHDAVEDQGGLKTLENIKQKFGNEVARIVLACSDSTGKPKPPWKIRKEAYLKKLPSEPIEVLRVSFSDKLHNGTCIWLDLVKDGEQTWDKFSGKKSGTLWYYQELLQVFSLAYPSKRVKQFQKIVEAKSHPEYRYLNS